MAAQSTPRPWRLLGLLLILTLVLGVWAFWPGTDRNVRLGLDLQGGTQVILLPKPVTEGESISEAQLQQTVGIIRQRVDGLGVAEAEITTQGSGDNAAIVVSVPGLGQERLVELVQRTALLNFRPVFELLSPVPAQDPANASPAPSESGATDASPAPSASAPADSSASPAPSASASPSAPAASSGTIVQAAENDAAYGAALAALNCTDPAVYAGGTPDDPTKWLGTCDTTGSAKYNLEPAFIQGTNVTGAEAQLQQNGLGWVVSLEFDGDGAKALADASTRLSALPDCGLGQSPCNAFAIVLDGVVVSAPRFNEPIVGGSAQIEGNFTAQEANDLANVLKYGALPVTLEVADITSVSATVGAEQLRAGLIAGGIGLLLVVLYLIAYYRALGVIAALSLVVVAALSYLALVVLGKSVGLTLTLAGVAGAIVAIGITADSFIVYFERIRDEIREGRTLRQAVDSGWVRARRTLLAADFVSFLAAVVLYLLSVGGVRGFAFVLGLTTIIDVIIAFWFTHPVVVLMGRMRWMQAGSRWTGLDPDRTGAPSVLNAMDRRRGSASEEVSS